MLAALPGIAECRAQWEVVCRGPGYEERVETCVALEIAALLVLRAQALEECRIRPLPG